MRFFIKLALVAIAVLTLCTLRASAVNYYVGTTNITVPAAAGTDSLVLGLSPSSGSWSATANSSWLHLNVSGIGNAYFTYTYDANVSAALRTGTLTVAGQTVTITQLGAAYSQVSLGVVDVVNGLNSPQGVSVDKAGNLYIADNQNNQLKEWNASTLVVSVLASDLGVPYDTAVDNAGNVYVANGFGDDVLKWTASSGTITTYFSIGNQAVATGVTLDPEGDVFACFVNTNTVFERAAGSGSATLVANGYNKPLSIAADATDALYIADSANNAITEYVAGSGNTTFLGGLTYPQGVAVDGEGNVYVCYATDNYTTTSVGEWIRASNTMVNLATYSFIAGGIAVDSLGSVFVTDTDQSGHIDEIVRAFVDPTQRTEGFAAGTDTLPPVLPAGFSVLPRFAPTSDQPWLTITGVTNGAVSIAFTRNVGPPRLGHVGLMGKSIPIFQNGVLLGCYSLAEGSGAAMDTVALNLSSSSAAWTASANNSWLHIASGSQSGVGSAVITFSFDANTGAPRTGTLTIAGETFTVAQAGVTFVAASPLTTLVSTGLSTPVGVAVDNGGNVYIADTGHSVVKVWSPTAGTLVSLGIGGLASPTGVAVDRAGNVYVADTSHSAIKEWQASSQTVSNLVTTGIALPEGVAVDASGNVYFSDSHNNAIKEWNVNSGLVSTLVNTGTTNPAGVAVDGAGNVFFADGVSPAVKKWSVTGGTLSTVLTTGLNPNYGVAIDGGGNLYVADFADAAVDRLSPVNGLTRPIYFGNVDLNYGVAVDSAEDIFIADAGQNAIKEIPRAFVDVSSRVENVAGASDTVVVLPSTVNLQGPFAPSSDQPWLTITNISGGIISFSVTPNHGTNRTGHLIVLGQSIQISQGASLAGTTSLVAGPAGGNNSVTIAVNPPSTTWSASANASWLHVNPSFQAGAGSTNVLFSVDSNPGPLRSGTLTIAGFTVTVNQAGYGYLAAPEPATPLVSSGLFYPYGLAVDTAGNVYIADTYNNAVKKWTVTNNTVTTLVSSGLTQPNSLAVDASGNVYIADSGDNAIKVWTASTQMVTNLVSTGLNNPLGVAVDSKGNVFIADFGNNAIKERSAANGSVTSALPYSPTGPTCIAVDVAGNLYYAENSDEIRSYNPVTGDEQVLVSSGLSAPAGLAVDGSGNVFIADAFNNAIKEWSAATATVTTIVSSNLYSCFGVAVDPLENVYVANTGYNSILELPGAFVPGSPVFLHADATGFALNPVVATNENFLPPFAPTSSQPWLSVAGVSNGSVQVSVSTNNSGASRQATLTVLGVPIFVSQQNTLTVGISNLLEGPQSGLDSIAVAAIPSLAWTASANNSWLHIVTNNPFNGFTNVVFSFDANSGPLRSGTLSIGSATVTVIQAPSNYVAASNAFAAIMNFSTPEFLAEDSAGNVFASSYDAIYQWSPVTGSVSAQLTGYYPAGTAVDSAGNLIFGDYNQEALFEWNASSGNVRLLRAGFTGDFEAMTVDSSGLVYIGNDSTENLQVWSPWDNSITTLFTGVLYIQSLAVGVGDNIFINENSSIVEYSPPTGDSQLILPPSPFADGMDVDGSGNLYFSTVPSAGQYVVQRQSAITGGISTLISDPEGIETILVDAGKNIFLADVISRNVVEHQHAFVDPTPVTITGSGAAAGALSPVLPATACLAGPFLPTSDQSWLMVTGVTNGVVGFAVAATTTNRTAHINLLGQSIPVTQMLPATNPGSITGVSINNGAFRLSFNAASGYSFTILSSTNLSTPISLWTPLGPATENPPGTYSYTDAATNIGRFYTIRSP